jgi:type I restriction enzyme S subunit
METTTQIETKTNAQSQLPGGWKSVRLGAVIAEAQSGFACGERDPHGVIQLRMNNVTTTGLMVWNDFLRVPVDAETVKRFRLVEGDVLFNNTNSTELVGKTALFKPNGEDVVYSNHFTRLRCKSDVLHPPFLWAWLNLQWQRRVFENLCNRWIGQSAVKWEKLAALSIPLPPLPEQKRIAAILTEQIAAVEKARKAAEAELEAARALPAAYLRAVFNSDEAKKWPRKPLGEICFGGGQYGTSVMSNAELKGVPILRMGNLFEGCLRWDNLAYIELPNDEEAKYVLSKGDILFNRTNSAELVGKTAVFDGSRRAVFASYLIRFKLLPSVADPTFLSAYINSEIGRKFIQENMARAIGQVNISASTMCRMPIPLPPLDTQRQIGDSIEKWSRSANTLSGIGSDQLTAINSVPAALLRKAFKGEL